MSERAVVRLLIAVTITAAAVRMLAILGLHPLNWDEIEFFRATDWVRQGLLPYRDFWEHHTPLQWYLFAPFSAMTSSPGAVAIVWMRIAQVPLWIATFWFANVWMKRSGIGAVGRWTAIALACCSSLLMLAAVEYRVDVVGCAMYLAALVVMQVEDRRSRLSGQAGVPVLHGVLLCLTGFANLRLGPLLALTVLLDAIIDRREHRWRFNPRVMWVILGVIITFALGLGYFAMRGALLPIYRHVWVENYLGDKYAQRIPWAFVHRMLIPFGIRIYGAGDPFEWSGIDIAGCALIILGLIGLVRALMRIRKPDETFFFAVLQLANMLFIARMKFVYNYHLEIVVMLMLPFVATEVERGSVKRGSVKRFVPAFAVIALVLSSALVIFRGKENDFAYQDLIMREADSHTPPLSKVFDGVGWALRRRPAYQFWFLPDLIRQLVPHGDAPPYRIAEWISDPPAAVITDRNCAVWLAQNPDLGAHVVHHYLPLWRNLWLPALSGITSQADKPLVWSVPADGDYRVIASPALVAHPWFHHPLAYRVSDRTELRVDNPSAISNVLWYVNNQPAAPLRGILKLHKRDVVTLVAMTPERIGVFLVPGQERVWFRQPPAGVTLDSESGRVTHVPDLSMLWMLWGQVFDRRFFLHAVEKTDDRRPDP